MKYSGKKLEKLSFPLGGIGTGSIGLCGNGRLEDFEIFGRPSKGSLNGYTHIAVKATQNGKSSARVLQGDRTDELIGRYGKNFGYGPDKYTMAGFPHFESLEFDGRFPIAELEFADRGFPGKVKLCAFNPFIPHDDKNSSIPAAFFKLTFENPTDEPIDLDAAFSLGNPFGRGINSHKCKDGVTLLKLESESTDPREYGSLSLATDSDCTAQDYWFRGKWMDSIVSFWNEFTSLEKLPEREYESAGENDTATLCAHARADAHETVSVRFVLSWHKSETYRYWRADEEYYFRHYYNTLFEGSDDSALCSVKNFDSLYMRTLAFTDALYGSTLDPVFLDAIGANLSVLKSPTVIRLEDGSLYGWEGVNETRGSCHGTCRHVWNYVYSTCFLFPRLERGIRDYERKYSTFDNGDTVFRILVPFELTLDNCRKVPARLKETPNACVDGQMGSVIKTYREWKISGDNEWLRENYETVKKLMAFTWSRENPDAWDLDHDGILEGRQHHTLDMELYSPSSWLESMYLAALAAAREMAEFMNDAEAAREYSELFENGCKYLNTTLYNGRYFFQQLDLNDEKLVSRFDRESTYMNPETGELKYQIGEGCEIDQLLGQWHADIVGLGNIVDPEKKHTALGSIFKYNYKPSMRGFANPWRVFSLGDEAGTVICAYPSDVRKPKIPIPYCEETMTGFEYQFAGLLVSDGRIDEALKVVKAVRDRYDGEKRNPWNEIECGNNYARSMASFALLPLLSGFEFDMARGHLGFDPKVSRETFRSLFSVGECFGSFELTAKRAKLELIEGKLCLSSFSLGKAGERVKKLTADGKTLKFEIQNGRLSFAPVTLNACLELEL